MVPCLLMKFYEVVVTVTKLDPNLNVQACLDGESAGSTVNFEVSVGR